MDRFLRALEDLLGGAGRELGKRRAGGAASRMRRRAQTRFGAGITEQRSTQRSMQEAAWFGMGQREHRAERSKGDRP